MASVDITIKRLAWAIPNWMRGWLVLGLGAGILILLALGLARSGSPLVVEVDGQRFELRTHAVTVGEALRQASFELYPEDRVSTGLDAPLQPGLIIQVQRARPVELQADGNVGQFRTHALTIGQLLAEAGVGLGLADEIWLDGRLARLDTPLWDSTPAAPRVVSQQGGAHSSTDTAPQEPATVAVRRAASLTLDDNGVTTTLYSTSATVGQVLYEQGVNLFLGDEVSPGLQGRIAPGMTVTILRSTPVEIKVDGRTVRTRTRAEDVAGALGQEGIALVGKDYAQPGLSSPLRSGMTIEVTRVREELMVEFDPIPFQTEWVADPEVEIDSIRLAREGQIGLTKQRQRIVHKNDQEVERFLEDVWAAQAPITRTMAYGTRVVIRTLETPDGPIEYWRKMRVYTTSYKPASCGKPKDHPRYGYTALGWKLKKGIVAVDPTVIPLRTKLYVPGYGFAQAGDTGGGVKGKFVDLGFGDNDYQSWHWWTDVYLLTPVPPRSQIRWILPDLPKFPDRARHR